MERQSYSDDPRKLGRNTSHWEESIPYEEYAVQYFNIIQDELEKKGIELKKDTKMLDVGSGQGVMVNFLNGNGFDITGLDIRPRNAQKLPVIKARIEELPFQNGTFDFLMCMCVFDFMVYEQDQQKMTEEMVRVLKPNGIIAALIFDDAPINHSSLTLLSARPIELGKTLVILQKNNS